MSWTLFANLLSTTLRDDAIRFGKGDNVELWELTAREQIRDAIALYSYAGDRFMIEEMVSVFCDDGVLETTRDAKRYVGRHEIASRLGGGMGSTTLEARSRAREQQSDNGSIVVRRHNVTNIHFERVAREEATVSSYFTVLTQDGLDQFGRYRDQFILVGERWLIQHRLISRDWQRSDAI
jgi:hypothetical protein